MDIEGATFWSFASSDMFFPIRYIFSFLRLDLGMIGGGEDTGEMNPSTYHPGSVYEFHFISYIRRHTHTYMEYVKAGHGIRLVKASIE